ncbi:phasin family protein [Novosphingobium sp. PY1]|uniref:phasin family protein n=1 Tax=Novosphingobium sp. PY1 TaxID=1882221 RepID=UPI001AAA1AE9|nr:phasin family protein [Novosphingobium sp. PY1]GFM27301.1 phasin [Novosphingobium sp. PY1]
MAGTEDEKGKALAEKAYEAAAASASDEPSVKAGKSVKPSAKATAAKAAPEESAAKKDELAVTPTEASKPEETPATEAKPEAAPVVETKAAAPDTSDAATAKVAPKAKTAPKAAVKPKTAVKPKAAAAKSKPAAVAKPKPAPVAPVKAAPAKPALEVAKVKPATAKPAAPQTKAAPKTVDAKSPVFAGLFTNFMLEEQSMDMSANFAGIQQAMTEAQAKAKAAFEKSTTMMGEVNEFTKGNVEAVMESGKIFAEGMQGLGSEIVSEGRSTFETMSGDIKELAAAKSPTDFFKIQGDMMRKNFDSAVAYSSKNSEAMLKLMSDVMAPISGRVSMAMEKVRQTSL